MSTLSIQSPLQVRFPDLQLNRSATGEVVTGGRFALPREFDRQNLASGFYAEGNECLSMQRRQPIMGTNLDSDGWTVWKYPEFSSNQKTSSNGQAIFDEKKNPIFEKHPSAGQPHKVSSLESNGLTYILMCRPATVQAQVNEVFGLLSIEQMAAEARGETIGGQPTDQQDPGMLSTTRLGRAYVEHEIEADREAEARMGRSSVVQTSLQSGGISKPAVRVSR